MEMEYREAMHMLEQLGNVRESGLSYWRAVEVLGLIDGAGAQLAWEHCWARRN